MMKPLFSFVLLLCFEATGSVNMFIFWGYPTDGSNKCVEGTASTFDDCVTDCQGSTTCMLAYGTEDSCMLCDVFTVSTIAQSDKEDGVKTAIKVDDPTDGCPSDMESEGYTRTNGATGYNLTFAGGVWKVSYGKQCLDDTWLMVDRPNGTQCIKVFSQSTPIGRYDAGWYCNETFNASLIGMQTVAELNYILKMAKQQVGSVPQYEYSGIWINGGRKGTCKTTTTGACAGILAFDYFGFYQSSFAAYTFAPGFPTIALDNSVEPNCLELLMSQSQTANNGMIKNAGCTNACTADGTVCGLSWVCGMSPTTV